MNIGIVGYDGCGKSTLFQLLTGAAPDPAAARTGQRAMAQVADPRLQQLTQVYKARKTTAAAVEIRDTPGLPRHAPGRAAAAASTASGYASRVAVLRECDGLVLVLGAFLGNDPLAELASFEEDILLADLEQVSGKIARLRESVRKPRPEREAQLAEIAQLEPLEAALGAGRPVRSLEVNAEQERAIRSFGLLTEKPRLVVVNTAEGAAADEPLANLRRKGERAEAASLRWELELGQLSAEERTAFADSSQGQGPIRDRLLPAMLAACGQLTFFTGADKEVRAWLVPAGSTAVDAAGAIHSDLARGFIRAEVMHTDDLLELGSEREVKAHGKYRLEGRDYVVQEGDILLIRFSV